VERLNLELGKLRIDTDAVVAENARLVESSADLSQAAGPTKTLVLAKKNLEIKDLRAELGWFRRREQHVQALMATSSTWETEAFVQLQVFMHNEPKPGAGT
jgi:hypothetical protein